jgi:hypothetical protein
MDQPPEKGAGSNDHRGREESFSGIGHHAFHSTLVNENFINHRLSQGEAILPFQNSFHPQMVQLHV